MRIAAIRLLARHPDRLATFLRDALDFETSGDGTLRLGEEIVEIEQANGAPYPADLASNDTRFQHFAVIVSDMEAAYARLRGLGGWRPISTNGPEQLPEASGGALAFKFRSPEGHPLELLEFPPAEKSAPWDTRRGLYLGIDHSAIGVADTQASIAFYSKLGFVVASRQTNRGPEQRRLDGLDASPVVEVTALQPPGSAPPHLELLCYRHPPAVSIGTMGTSDVAATRLMLAGLDADRHDPDGHRLAPAPV